MNFRNLQNLIRHTFTGLLAALLFGYAVSACAGVKLPNGEYTEQVEDLRVQILGGPLSVTRTWLALNINKGEYRWYLNPAWADLVFDFDTLDGSIKSILRAGSRFERSGNDIYVFEKIFFISRQVNASGTTTGWHWYDRLGNWIAYAADGKIVSYGDRNGVSVNFVRNGSGQIAQVNDHHGAMALTIAYDAERVASVTDRAGRIVRYNYGGDGNLTEVIDVLGRRWSYGYTGGLLTSKSGPTCDSDLTCGDESDPARTTIIQYSGNRVVKVIDPMMHAVTWEYAFDRGKRQYTVVEKSPEGRRIERRYDAEGRLLTKTAGTRVVYSLRRDGKNVEIVTDERGLTTRTEFDANRNIVKVVHPDGTTKSASFHSRFNLPVEQIDELGTKTRSEYDDDGNLVTLTEAVGTPVQRVTRYTYDDYGYRLTRTIVGATYADDAKTTFEYDDYGNMTKTVDAENRVGETTHHVTGEIEKYTDARGKIWMTTYDAAGRKTASRNPLGHVESTQYGKFGNIKKEIDQIGKETTYATNPNGQVRALTDPMGGTTIYFYDQDGYTTKIEDPNSVATTFGYDAYGRLTTTTDAAGNTVTEVYGQTGDTAGLIVQRRFPTYCEEYKYDQRGRKTKETRVWPCDGESQHREDTSFGHDAKGRVVSKTDSLQQTTVYVYDALDRLVETTNALGGKTAYGYDLRGNRVNITVANGGTYRYAYDKVGQLVSETRPLGGRTTYAYDASGNPTSLTTPDGARQVSAFDDARRRIGEKLYAAGQNTPAQTIVFAYDDRNLMTSYTQQGDTNSSAVYVHDDNQRRVSESVTYGFGASAFTRTISYDYYANGLKKKIVYPDQTTINYTYDANNRLETAGLPGGGEVRWQEYQWDKATRTVMPGAVRTVQYDELQRPKRIMVRAIGAGTVQAPAGATALSLEYEYDAVDNVVGRTGEEGAYGYVYDALGRLTRATPPSSVQSPTIANGLPVENYSYDAMSNRKSSSHQPGPWNYNADNQLLDYGAGTLRRRFEYNASGQTVRVFEGGEPSISQMRFVYGAAQRLIEVYKNDAMVGRYDYDPFGRRIRKQTQTGVVWFQYADAGLVAEYSNAGTLVRTYGWLPGEAGGTNPLWLADKSGSTWNVGLYQNDALGTPHRVTDTGGDVVWSAMSEAFGRALVATTSIVSNPLRSPGQYFDDETGLHYNYFRDYDPAAGRYLQTDPIGLDGGLNTYVYVGSSPIRYFDRLGLFKAPLPCLTTEDCYCNQNPSYCTPNPKLPKKQPRVPPPGAGTGTDTTTDTTTDEDDCTPKCKNSFFFSDFQECKDLPGWYKYPSKDDAAKSQGGKAVARKDSDGEKGICLKPGGHWRIEVEGHYDGYSVIECRCCEDTPKGPEIKSVFAVPGAEW